MSLSTPARLNPRRRLRQVDKTLGRLPSTRHVLRVEFVSSDGRGRGWHALGGGNTLADAIAFARDSCPTDSTWEPVHWNDVYGD